MVKSGGVSRQQGDALEWAALSGQTIEKKLEGLSCEFASANGTLLRVVPFFVFRRDVTAWEGTPQRPQRHLNFNLSVCYEKVSMLCIAEDTY